MKKLLLVTAAAVLASMSFGTVLDFEDLTGSSTMVDGYGGITWSPGAWNHYDSPQPPYNPGSGVQRIYCMDPSNSFLFQTASVFDGAFVNGHGAGDGYGDVRFDMYLSNVWVATSASAPLDGSGVGMFLNSGYSGLVDKVVVTGTTDYFIVDDVTFNSVPEPASMAVLALGGAFLAKRRKRSA